jgi:phage-related minor tail protein
MGRIRGITVEIGGNTTKLDKALGESQKKSRSLQTELREVTKLLKFDPTNTELLAQKQEILTSAISETGEKLKILEEAQAQVAAQFERGEIGEEQYRAFQRELMQTEKDLNDLRSELASTETALKNVANGTDTAEKHTDEYRDSVEKAKEELSEFKEKAEETFEAFKTGAGILGGAAVATGGYALKLSTDFDKAFNTLVTRTGASADEMDSLNESMERVYANNFGDSIEDVANSMATVKVNTKLSGDELQNATERALLLRDTFEFDVNESTRTAKMLMDQYGMSADEAFNLIAQGAQNGLDKNGDLLDTINEYSVHFNNLGLGAEDMFNMLVNGAENGTFSVDKLGDAVKEFGIRAKDGSDATADAFAALGLNADETSKKFAKGGEDAKSALDDVTKALFEMDDPLAQNQVGVALFGTMWEDLGVEGVKALMGVEGEISKTSTALDDINNQKYDDIGSALEGLGRTIETDLIDPLGDELKPVVEEAIEYVKENGPQIKDLISEVVQSVGDFVGWIVDNGDLVVSTIVAIGTGLLVWNVASMINSVVGAIKAYKLANEGATIAQALFNAVLNANPLMLIATLVLALVAGIVTFIMTNDEARAKFVEIWNKIKETAKKVLDAIVKFFKESWESIKKAWDSCVTFFSGLWDKIKNVYSGVKSWFSSTFKNAWEAVKNSFSGWGQFFSNLWTQIKDKFSTIGSNIATAINGSVRAGINGVIGAVESIINKGIGLINSAISLANKLPGVNIGQMGLLRLPRLAKGAIVDKSTIAEIGEDGREAVIPLEKNTGWMKLLARELTSYMRPQGLQDGALLSRLDRIYDRLNRLQVVLDSGELVGGIVDGVDEALGDKYTKVARGW